MDFKPFAVRVACLIFLALVVVRPAIAQVAPPAAPPDHVHPASPPDERAATEIHVHDAGATGLFASRDASGTAWQPDATTMYGIHHQARGWELMLHGNAFLQLLHESAPEHRGGTQAGSLNWAMAMMRRPLGRGRIGVRMMTSLEAVTIPGCGYPNLLQTGEFCDGDSIHDRQHPHDLFMEIASEFDRPLSQSWRWQLYGGLAGEPALGPPGFPHRASAMPNPISPIAHHWLDATHISYGVVTAGVYGPQWKVETSAFNGREPDEERLNVDLAPLDSVAARLTFLPGAAWAVQVSAGSLRDAEPAEAGGVAVDVTRMTSSATYHRRVGTSNLWATTIAWGANRESGTTTHGVLLESSASLTAHDTVFGRAEVNSKSAHDLHIHESSGVFTVGKLQAGYTRHLDARRGLQPGVGATLSAAVVPSALEPRYGGVGFGVGVFLTVRPAAHQVAP